MCRLWITHTLSTVLFYLILRKIKRTKPFVSKGFHPFIIFQYFLAVFHIIPKLWITLVFYTNFIVILIF